MHTSLRDLLTRAVVISLSAASVAGSGTYAAQRGAVNFDTPTHHVSVTTSDTPAPMLRMARTHRSQPAEDSPRFDCRIHGNRSCGVAFDPTPNNRNRNVKRYVIVFDRKGNPVDVVPFGKAPRN